MHTRERHIQIGRYIKDIIFAANDGIITTFAVVASVAGAHLSPTIVIIIGVANMLADGFSMATSNYLGTKSEQELYAREERIERHEIEHIPEHEKKEVREILEGKGYKGEELATMADLITTNHQHWLDFMMHEEMGLSAPGKENPLKKGLITFLSFIIAGSIPLLPYSFGTYSNTFRMAIITTGIALFSIGALRHYFSDRHWLLSGIEMLIIGGSAAGMAYGMGFVLNKLLG